MEYKLDDGRVFLISYTDLKEQYTIHCEMSDDEFKKNLPSALHLAIVICFFKEIPTYLCLSDIGIVHELAHFIHIPEGNTTSFKSIRKLFKEHLKLA